jgi:hypothetical protein
MVLTDLKLGKILIGIIQDRFCIFVNKGIIDVDPETGLRYYIDPISMIIANIQESSNSTIVPLYYKVYNKIIPRYTISVKFWTQLSGVAAYAVITQLVSDIAHI